MSQLNDARCEALFASELQRSERPTAEAAAQAISRAARKFGIRGCASRMAQEFGNHPQEAAERMRWARQVVAEITAWPHPRRTPARTAHSPRRGQPGPAEAQCDIGVGRAGGAAAGTGTPPSTPRLGGRSAAGMSETCDRCGPAVRAVYRVARHGELNLCRHCARRHWPVLAARGWTVGPACGNSPAPVDDRNLADG